jgi:transmembrane sensor
VKANSRLGKNGKSHEQRNLDNPEYRALIQDQDLFDRPKDIPPPIARRAVEWLMELQSGNTTDATRKALQQWLNQHPDHERAWRHIEAINQKLCRVGAASSVAHATLAQPSSARRRETIKALAVLLFAGGGAWMIRDEMLLREWLADEQTGVGERRTIRLTDGTVVDLNTDSAISVHFGAAERRVRLINGEILVSTGKEGGLAVPPFLVETAHGELRPLGTRFMVRHQDDACRVDVFEGAVMISPGDGLAPTRTLYANEGAHFTRSTIGESAPTNVANTAWTDGWLVVSGMSLSDFLSELGRHRPGRLSCDPAVAQLRVSGSYPLNDTDRILNILHNSLPIEIHFFTRYWVTVRPRHS